VRAELAAASAGQYGRARALVDADLAAALARVERLRQGGAELAGDGMTGNGVERDGGSGAQIRVPDRSNHRPPRADNKKKGKGKQGGRQARLQEQLALPDTPEPETPGAEVESNPERAVLAEDPEDLGENAP
jgi:hypothetical protein